MAIEGENQLGFREGATAQVLVDLGSAGDLLAPFEVLRRDAYPWLLDSALPDRRLGRFSFAGSDPYLVLRARGEQICCELRREVGLDFAAARPLERGRSSEIQLQGDLLVWLRRLLPRLAPSAEASSLPFLGGAVGYFGYELGVAWEPKLSGIGPAEGLEIPDACLLFVDRLLILDHEQGRCFASGLGFGATDEVAEERAGQAAEELAGRVRAAVGAKSVADSQPVGNASASISRAVHASSYGTSVDRILEAIRAGDVYQACLTHRIEVEAPGADPWATYLDLRQRNPAPFASFLDLPEMSVLGSSPERFLRVDAEGQVESRPIKGTRPRGRTPEEDRALAEGLARAEKDRAENLMIADLVRNDLGRVCQLGSVEVSEFQVIEEYATVFQMVTAVRGVLRPDCDRLDCLRAAFPPGSMTGAPKIAAMQLLAELESVRRGIYSGALGYLDCRGGMDLAVVIRTTLLRKGSAYVQVGGGVVSDSDPLEEYRESLDKAKALLATLGAPLGEDPESS